MAKVISLGGSVVIPEEIDIEFLKRFRQLILNQTRKGQRFIIIVGGGRTCRNYQKAASKVARIVDADLDWLGIHATRLNAQLLRTIFRANACPKVIRNYNEKIKTDKKIMIASGWKPGHSTDYDAVMLAKNFKATTIINITNIDCVYSKDPNKFKDAKRIEHTRWQEFRKLVGDKWKPGLNAPFDPVASKKAQQLKLKVIITGKDIQNLQNILEGKRFKGTIIE